jgi:flagella basal body P-ring formation protein FlgA
MEHNTALLALAVAGVAISLGGPTAPAVAAEFQLRAQCQVHASLVRLDDVAEIYGSDRQQVDALRAIELFPSPPPGQPRFLPIREIQDLLLLRGVNLTEHHFSGSSQVVINGGEAAVAMQRALAPADVRMATQRLREALMEYFRHSGSAREMPTVEFQLTGDQAHAITAAAQNPSVSGGVPPWIGAQRMMVTVVGTAGPVAFPLDVQLAHPTVVAVAARGLTRGSVIRPEDIVLSGNVAPGEQGNGFRSTEELIGREVTKGVAEGRVIDRGDVRAPVVVRRGDVVTVYARSPGIRIKTLARARDDGGVGDLVGLESLYDRKTFFARVCGVQEVEIYARAVQAEETAAVGDAGPLRR